MITCVFPPSSVKRAETQKHLASLRDERLKRAGCTSAERVAFYAKRIELIRSSKS